MTYTFKNFRRQPSCEGKVFITADCIEVGREVFSFLPASVKNWQEVAQARMSEFVSKRAAANDPWLSTI